MQGLGCRARPYSYLKVHHLFLKCAHLVVEAEPVFSLLFRCEHKVSLALLLPVHNCPLIGAYNGVIDIEGASRLDLISNEQRISSDITTT